MVLKDALELFLITQEIKGNSKRTLEYYRLNLGYFLSYLGYDYPVCNITLLDLNNFYLHLKKRNVSTVTLQTYIRALRTFLNWCYDEEYISIKLTDRFRLPKAEKKVLMF